MLQKYRRKETVEAVQWFPGLKIDGILEDPAGSIVRTLDGDIIKTPEGYIKLNSGDWIVDISGKKQICRADKFEKLYEPMNTVNVVAISKEQDISSPALEDFPMITKRPRRKL